MALPRSHESRTFYRAAKQRFEDADFLLRVGADQHTTASVYLAGYSVECILKSLLLAESTSVRGRQIVSLFRGRAAHDFEWLRQQLMKAGVKIPDFLALPMNRVGTWSTDLRYATGYLPSREAKSFLHAAREIIVWADGRM